MNDKMKPALIGGLTLGVLSGIPVVNFANCACCAWVIAGGLLASYLWMKGRPFAQPPAQPPYGEGALLGGLTGVIGAVVSSAVALPFSMLMGGNAQEMLSGILESMPEGTEIPPALTNMISGAGSGAFSVVSFFFGLMVSLVIYAIFAAVGALIGVALFKKK